MLVTPSVIYLDYKKNDSLPPAVLINYPDVGYNLYFENAILDANGWPTEVNLDWVHLYDITHTSLKVKLNDTVNSLQAGEYTKDINLVLDQVELGKKVIAATFTVKLYLTDTITLSVSPPSISYSFEIGGTPPVNKTLSILSENDWNITKNADWLLLPTTSGSNSGTFQVGVDVTALPPGTHTDTITVNDGVSEKTVSVILTVSNPNTGTDYLYINPTLLKFGFTSGGTIPPQKTIELNASASWTVTASETWVNLPTTSGDAGAEVVPIALQNISGLGVGEHFATVTFSVGNIKKTVTIQLTIFEFITELLNSGELYFCDDPNFIKVSSNRLDTFMQLVISTLYKSKSFTYPFETPYFNGTTQKRIGSTPKKLIGHQNLVGFAEAALFSPYPTINLDIAISELELFTKNLVQSQSINNVKFVKGTKPLNNWISDLPKTVYITKTAILYFSVVTQGITAYAINITGAITKSFNFAAITSDLLTAVVPIADVGELAIGDVIYVEVLENTIEVIIKDEGKETSVVYWSNKWGVWDSVELTGDVKIKSNFNRKTTTNRKTELQTETKVIDVTKPIEYSINSGWIHTNAEVETLDKMLEATNMYLLVNNQLVKVNPTTKNLIPYETDRYLKSFNLTFKNVLE